MRGDGPPAMRLARLHGHVACPAAPAASQTPPAPAASPTAAQRQHLHDHGWLIVDDACPAPLLQRLREAAAALAPRVRSGEMDARSGKLRNDVLRANSQSYLLTPLGGEPCFAEWYGSRELLRYVTAFLERPAGELCLGDFALFAQREPSEFNSAWHRSATPHHPTLA